jgi:hypothetical protein
MAERDSRNIILVERRENLIKDLPNDNEMFNRMLRHCVEENHSSPTTIGRVETVLLHLIEELTVLQMDLK